MASDPVKSEAQGGQGSAERGQTLDLRILFRAIEQSPSIVMITDLRGGIEYVNPKFTEVTGYTAQEVMGQNPRFLKSGKHEPAFYDEMWTAVRAGQEWWGEFCNLKKNREFYWESASMSAVKNAAGQITHFVKVGEDITRRKEAEEVLRRYAAELEVQNAELDAFAHTVAHDLKNPLTLVSGYTSFLEEAYAEMPADQVVKLLEAVSRNVQKMDGIIDELLLLAKVRRDDVPVQPIHMAPLVAEAVARLEPAIKERGAEVIVAGTWPLVLGYGPWVEEVWINYLSNALKYGGTPPRVELGATAEGNMVRFWVRDYGPGLTAEERARLFAPFARLRPGRAQGHGLGLSIVRRIVEKLGGQVSVASEGIPGRGSLFCFTLPAAPREPDGGSQGEV